MDAHLNYEDIQPLLLSMGSMGVLFDLRSFSHQYHQTAAANELNVQ
jgi:hypothetical protein